jgi:hypothetical protein
MHQTLDDSILALAGPLPAVVVSPEIDAPLADQTETGVIVQAIEEIRRTLNDAAGRLQELLNQLRQEQ